MYGISIFYVCSQDEMLVFCMFKVYIQGPTNFGSFLLAT
jgi:hypothetical protein